MPRKGLRKSEWIVVAAAAVGIGAVIWLAPLMTDQIVFFADREQTLVAEASRWTMLPVSGVLVACAAVLGRQVGLWHGVLAALPALIAVPLAWIAPGPAYQVLAYGATAPWALGALLIAAVPRLSRLVRRR